MLQHTENFNELREAVQTEHDRNVVVAATAYPSVIIERAKNLMALFMQNYLDGNQGKERLIAELHLRPQIIESLFDTFFMQTVEVEAMLIECQEIAPAATPAI